MSPDQMRKAIADHYNSDYIRGKHLRTLSDKQIYTIYMRLLNSGAFKK